MLLAPGGEATASRRANHQFAPQQEGFDVVFQRVCGRTHRVGDGLDADRTAGKHPLDRLQVAAVEAIEAEFVDALHLERRTGDFHVDAPLRSTGGEIANPAQAVIGEPRRAPAPLGNLVGRRIVHRHVELHGRPPHDLGQILPRIEVEMLPHHEPVSQRRREQARPRRRSDERERPQRHVDRAGRDTVAERDVDPEILHRGIEELLDRDRHAMDFIDEEHRALGAIGQVGEEVLRRGERRPAGDLERGAQLLGNAGGKRRLAEARRPVEQNVAQRFAPFPRGIDGDREPFKHRPLADHLAEPLRPQRAILLRRIVHGLYGGLAKAFHGVSPARILPQR